MAVKNTTVRFEDLGLVDYLPAFEYQERLMKDIIDLKLRNRDKEDGCEEKTPNYFLFVEHPNVYTLGKSGHDEHLLINDEKLKEINAIYVKTNRGGDITYHGYGQVVGYPILDLENFKPDIRLYMRNLEEVIIRTIAEYGLDGQRSDGETGVWLDVGSPFARKICAMGVKASRWVTMHGFALNVNTDMKYFNYIVPCGIRGKSVTSLRQELEREIPLEEVKDKIKKYFLEVFGAKKN